MTAWGSYLKEKIHFSTLLKCYWPIQASSLKFNKEASRLYAELLLCVCWHSEHI